MKALGSQAEEQNKGGAASLRRPNGFGAEPSQAAVPGTLGGGFGRRKTPIPSTTDGMPPRMVANDRAMNDRPTNDRMTNDRMTNDRTANDQGARSADAEIELGRSFGLQAAHDEDGGQHAAAVAIDDLSNGLLAWLRAELRSGREARHEAVLCALGALAGYAAQQAIREAFVKPGRLTLDQAFVVIETRSGEVFFFGDLLNAIIVSKGGGKNGIRESGHASIWKVVSDGGYDAGAINLPDVNDMIKHCAATVGRDEFGIPRVPDAYMPQILPREAIARFWPTARRKLAGAEPMSWPLHLAMAAYQLIVELKDTIRPDIAVQIVMESAVPMSKIDPVTLPKE
jgi:hypothetical protein